MKKIIFGFCFLSILGLAQHALAAEALEKTASLSLAEALRISFASNPKLAEARKDITAAKGKWFDAAMLPDPEFEIDVGGLKAQRLDQKTVHNGNLDAFAVKQPIDPLGTHLLKSSIAHDSVKIVQGQFQTLWAEIRKEVIETYANILAQEKAVEIADENLEITKQFFEKVQLKFEGGGIPKSDVLRAKIEVSRASNNALINNKDLKVAQGSLNLLLGRDAQDPLQLSDSLTYSTLKYRYDAVRDNALANRSDLQNEKTRLRSSKKELWAAWLTAIFPKLSFGVERATQDFQNDTSLILEGSYPLWGFNFGQIKEAKAENEKQQIHVDAMRQQIGLEVYQAYLEAELANRQVLLQQKALEEANELLKQVTLKYEEGEVPFLTYLENIKTIKETKTEYYLSLKNYQEKVAELERTSQVSPLPQGQTQ